MRGKGSMGKMQWSRKVLLFALFGFFNWNICFHWPRSKPPFVHQRPVAMGLPPLPDGVLYGQKGLARMAVLGANVSGSIAFITPPGVPYVGITPDPKNASAFIVPAFEEWYVKAILKNFMEVDQGTAGVYMDIGANFGHLALPMATVLGRASSSDPTRLRTVALEAVPKTFACLAHAAAANRLVRLPSAGDVDPSPMLVMNYAMGSSATPGEFVCMVVTKSNFGGATVKKDRSDCPPEYRVPSQSLDGLLVDQPALRAVLFLKMDCEGCEPRVLEGASRLLREAPPCVVGIEANVFENSATGLTLPSLIAMIRRMQGFDYSVFQYVRKTARDWSSHVEMDPVKFAVGFRPLDPDNPWNVNQARLVGEDAMDLFFRQRDMPKCLARIRELS